jgi:hypothetical protein
MTMFPSRRCLGVETSLSTSPLRTAGLFQAGWATVADATYLGRLFRLSAISPLRDGDRTASHSQLRRPEGRPRRPAPRRARAWQGAGYFRSGRSGRGPEAFVTGWVLDDSAGRDVPARDDLSHFGSAPHWSGGNQTLAACPASLLCLSEQPVAFAGPPGVILDGFHEVFVDDHGPFLLVIGVVGYRRRRRGWEESVRCSLTVRRSDRSAGR